MPYTATEGLLTSANKGAVDGGVGERVLVDYKDALQDYKASDLDVMSMFAQTMTTDTGGDIDLSYALPSMKLESIDEGSTPAYQHTKMRSERAGDGEINISDLLTAIELIGQHGYNADTLLLSPQHYNSLLSLADFTAVYTAGVGATATIASMHKQLENTFVEGTNQTRIIGTIYGLNVISNPWVPVDKICVMDASVKPVAYVERRGLTVEEANPGFGIVGSYLSLRYGLKIINPLSGVVINNK